MDLKNMRREDTLNINNTIAARFKAFFEEDEEKEMGKKFKKDKNLILVKKEYWFDFLLIFLFNKFLSIKRKLMEGWKKHQI